MCLFLGCLFGVELVGSFFSVFVFGHAWLARFGVLFGVRSRGERRLPGRTGFGLSEARALVGVG